MELDEAPVAFDLSPKQQLLAVATVDDSIQRARYCLSTHQRFCL